LRRERAPYVTIAQADFLDVFVSLDDVWCMEFWQSLLLGLVEGITEYLPVSSTGHLLVTQRLLGIGMADDKTAADAFAISIQGGAIAAVMGLYYKQVWQMFLGLLGKSPAGLQLLIKLVIAFLPAAVTALTLEKWIKAHLFGIQPIILAWFVGGALILAVGWWKRRNPREENQLSLADMTWRMALVIGLLQCVAMWPGTSRSLMTIVGGIVVGLRPKDAVEFSFLLGVMTLGAATAKDTLEYGTLMLETFGFGNLLAGFLASTLSAALAVKWLVSYLQKHGMELFGWYRIAIAVIAAILVGMGLLHDSKDVATTASANITSPAR
jgi:undecaprenyl-diphosphatase